MIPKFQPKDGDFNDLLLIGFDKTNLEDQNHLDRMVHFFLYDYRFERVWKNPEADIEKLSRYRAVLSPDFSMYLEMAPVMQMYNVFRNRWCGAYWASKGIRVTQPSIGVMNPPLISALTALKRAALWQFQPTWLPSMIIERIRRNGSWLVTMRCCGV